MYHIADSFYIAFPLTLDRMVADCGVIAGAIGADLDEI